MVDPYGLAMVLCDAVHQDPATGKFTILGTFSNFHTRTFPNGISFTLYCAVTDGSGPTEFRIQIVDASGEPVDGWDDTVYEHRIAILKSPVIPLKNRFEVFEFPLRVEDLLIERGGVYDCELWANKKLLMTRRFTATSGEDSRDVLGN